MTVIGWIVFGLIAGFIASRIVNKSGEGFILDIVLGIVGAVVGGFIFAQFGSAGVTGFNVYSMIVAIIGAIVVLVIYHAIVGGRAFLGGRPSNGSAGLAVAMGRAPPGCAASFRFPPAGTPALSKR
jgi:uncharacterized membrane protein YeaQ/YmgE (transglycosylase-associated protein family)